MADPNIVLTSTVKGKTALVDNILETDTTIVSNSQSDTVLKIGTLIISNIDGTTPYDVSVMLVRSGTSYKLVSTVSVPPDTSLAVLSRDTSVYLQENDTLKAVASTANKLHAVCSYEEIA